MSSSAGVPAPQAAGELDPLVTEWAEGRRIVRCHNPRHGPAEFNRTASPGRFRPVRRGGRIIGTLYGSEDLARAVSETVFHDLPVGAGPRFRRIEALAPMVASTLSPLRALRLATLHGHGLRRLGATRPQLIDSEADRYPELAAWGQALHDCPAEPDGIVWRSRHYDDRLRAPAVRRPRPPPRARGRRAAAAARGRTRPRAAHGAGRAGRHHAGGVAARSDPARSLT